MDDLITWLRAQLDEDERVAREAGGAAWSVGTEETPDGENAYYSIGAYGEEPFVDTDVTERAKFDHIVYWDPARVLREVEAKRAIIDMHQPDTQFSSDQQFCRKCATGDSCDDCLDYSTQVWPCSTLRLLALPYSDHPGYEESWRP
ncbi:DUF6221 family protein [Amycolatopsis sp. NPDC049159]|uniref:DUF6221 family protein n=1 Tax=Amycolatopsis sp. NPDC049159 TaxID=3157210 RepID=UPI0033D92E91